MNEDVKEWLEKAEHDLKEAKYDVVMQNLKRKQSKVVLYK